MSAMCSVSAVRNMLHLHCLLSTICVLYIFSRISFLFNLYSVLDKLQIIAYVRLHCFICCLYVGSLQVLLESISSFNCKAYISVIAFSWLFFGEKSFLL
jgi:hypothetical protein